MSQPIKGMDSVLRNLNREISKLKSKSEAGLVESGLYIKAQALPKTPVEFGNLRGSGYVVSQNSDDSPGHFSGPDSVRLSSEHGVTKSQAKGMATARKNVIGVVVGFSAYYAIYVHEIQKAYKAPGTQWKYLETAVKENSQKILDIIRGKVKV